MEAYKASLALLCDLEQSLSDFLALSSPRGLV